MEVLLKNENCSAKVISKGAELKSLTVRGRELMWRADPAFWNLPPRQLRALQRCFRSNRAITRKRCTRSISNLRYNTR